MSKTFSIAQALAVPSNIALLRKHNVVYVDRGLIAINKPSGLVTQGTINPTRKEGTIQVAIDDIQPALDMTEGPYTVHRLDKHTTGLYILATTSTQAKTLSRAFAPSIDPVLSPKKSSKQYIALVHTCSPRAKELFGSTNSSGPQAGTKRRAKLDLYVNRDGLVSLWADVVPRIRHAADLENSLKRKKVALSEIEVLAVSPKYQVALVGLQLFTGVKHQLRVTLASFFKAPVLGDTYGEAMDKSSLPVELTPPGKLMLHSSSLTLERFHNKRPFTFQIRAPPPKQFTDACRRAGIALPLELQAGGVFYNSLNVTQGLRREQDCNDEEVETNTSVGDGFKALEGVWID